MASRSRLYWLLGFVLLAISGTSGCLDQNATSAYEVTELPQASDPAALQKKIDELVDYTLNQRLMSVKDQAAWQIVHGLEAYGRQLPLVHDGKVSSALEYLMAGGYCKGWVLRPGDKGVISVSDPGSKTGQGHPDQWIGYLSQCGDVKLDDPFVISPGGKTYHVRDLLAQSQWDLFDGMEASWTLMAAVTYLPMDAQWTSKDGQHWTIERVAEMEAKTKPGTGGCYDTHRLYALALALNREARESNKKPEQLTGGWKVIYDRVQSAVQAAHRFCGETPDGSFSTSFFELAANSPDLGAQVYSGGHTLEFVAVALPTEQLSDEWVTKAVWRLCEQLDELRQLNPDCGSLYHAAHGLQLYRNLRFGERKPVLAASH
jgi:hypothetical protein